MKFEKSCGAVVYITYEEHVLFLVIQHKNGQHWGFPKGHVEEGETELQTAVREIEEETGLKVQLDDSFRYSMEYSPKEGIMKEVIYFIAKAEDRHIDCQKSEVEDYRWLQYEASNELLTHQNSKELLEAANEYLKRSST